MGFTKVKKIIIYDMIPTIISMMQEGLYLGRIILFDGGKRVQLISGLYVKAEITILGPQLMI